MRSAMTAAALAAAVTLSGCATTGAPSSGGSTANASAQTPPKPLWAGQDGAANPDPFPSTYRPLPRANTAIVGATVLTATGQEIANGVVLMSDGKITGVGGADTPVPAGFTVVDARGKWVTPGVIDAHSHLGVYPSPAVAATSDGNEITNPNTANVWSEHSIWPQDEGFNTARAGGVTTMQILPGSGNLFGGRSVTIKNVPSVSMQAMKFPGAPYGLKMACGENPPNQYGARNQSPATGMGNIAVTRQAWVNAADYARKWEIYRETGRGEPPRRDLQLETMAGVLKGEITVQNHCYRADEMVLMLDVAKEFGYKIRTFHHASEAYKIAPRLAREGVCSAIWGAGWWGFKMESLDGIEENGALLHQAGACVVIHSDDQDLIQRLNQETAMAVSAARRAGINIPRAEAVKWFTLNPAKAIGVENQVGSLEVGKNADVVIWSADPLSVYSRAERVFIDGAVVYDRNDPRYQPTSDFLLGAPGRGAN